jgi:hypothetical protein
VYTRPTVVKEHPLPRNTGRPTRASRPCICQWPQKRIDFAFIEIMAMEGRLDPEWGYLLTKLIRLF